MAVERCSIMMMMMMSYLKPKLHYFDLLSICCTTNLQQIAIMEFNVGADVKDDEMQHHLTKL